MWTREELKTSAKTALKANYWRSVGAGLLMTVAVGGVAASSRASTDEEEVAAIFQNAVDDFGMDLIVKVMIAIIASVLVVSLISTLIKIFLLNPLYAGCNKFFINSLEQGGEPLVIVSWPLKNNYLKNVGTLFLRNLFVSLWSLLLVVPGIIKSYEYRMVSYILVDQPELSRKEVFALSKKMMQGNKWAAFVLDLSFIGWNILAAITLNIVGIFYVMPYYQHTDAALYLKLKSEI